jgi:hypothetical protein
MKRPYERIVFRGGVDPLGLAPEQVAWLAEHGHVRRAGQDWHALVSKAEIQRLVLAMAEVAKCDFCSDRPIVATFGASDFEFLPHVPLGERQGSTGSWAACETCAGLIRASDEAGLFEHCVEKLLVTARSEGMPMDRPEVRAVFEEAIRAAQSDFWARRDKTEAKIGRGES